MEVQTDAPLGFLKDKAKLNAALRNQFDLGSFQIDVRQATAHVAQAPKTEE
jgi:hypothetical protein